jgi:hypothetical protein
MWEKPYISIFVEIGALPNFTHFGGHLKNEIGQNSKNIVIMAAIFKMFAKAHQHFKVLQFQRKLIFRRFST